MIVESLTNAKNQLSRLIERVRQGERVRILVHGVPAADLVPVDLTDEAPGMDVLGLRALERQGVIRPALAKLPKEILNPGPSAPGTPLSRLIQDERDGR